MPRRLYELGLDPVTEIYDIVFRHNSINLNSIKLQIQSFVLMCEA